LRVSLLDITVCNNSQVFQLLCMPLRLWVRVALWLSCGYLVVV